MNYGITADRRTGRTASMGGITLPAVSYSYAPASGELESVTSGDVTATYHRTAATGWNEGLTYTTVSVTASTYAERLTVASRETERHIGRT